MARAKDSNKKIWQTSGSELHPLVEKYTVGDDHTLDQFLLPYDVEASIAHAKMLQRIGILNKKELGQAERGLKQILALWKDGKFTITPDQEDCHTAIEHYLTKHYGEVGKKIHTGRSRNDQALVMLRLFMKEQLGEMNEQADVLRAALEKRAKETKAPMPGYTHMQKAMPTSVQTWLMSYANAITDAQKLLKSTRTVLDQNPLGSASGFGIQNFKLDRAYTTKQLKFSRTQQNPMYCGLSRGYFEHLTLSVLGNFMFLSGKFATDMMLFTMKEFNYFSLPNKFTTGSSIMPQKRNYDVFEIMRGNTKVFRAYEYQVHQVIDELGSGYHRDLQLAKRPLIEGVTLCKQTVELLTEIIKNLKVHDDVLRAAMADDLFVTNDVYALVNEGRSFRDAYQEVKMKRNHG